MFRRRVAPTGLLRVLFVVPGMGVGGAERHVATLMTHLDPARFAPSLVSLGQGGPIFDEVVTAGVPARAFGHVRRDLPRTLAELVAHMRRARPDVVVLRGANAEALGRVAAALTGVPRTVVWVHNNADLTPRTWLRRLADRVLEPVTSAYFGVAHGQLPYLIETLGHPAAKVRIIQNGVAPGVPAVRDPALAAALGIPDDAPVVGTVGVLRPEKDHATFLRAARLVLDVEPRTRFLVVGFGDLAAELKALAAELGIAGQVVFTGERADVAALLGLMDVFVLTSSTEAFPMALLEAMAAGRPAVCTAVGGMPEMIEDGVAGHLVPPGEPAVLAQRLLAMLGDPARTRAMGAAARARLEAEFTLGRSVRRAEQALDETAGRVPPVSGRPVRLTLLCDYIAVGGAEQLLLNLFRGLDPAVVQCRVLCLKKPGPMGAEFAAAGFAVEVLGRGGRHDLRTVPRLARRFRATGTDVVLVHHLHPAPLTLGRVAARLAGAVSVITPHGMDTMGWSGHRCLPRHDVETLFLSAAIVWLAPSQGAYFHREENVGRHPWSRTREVVIPNGVPLPAVPTPADRTAARVLLGVGEDELVVGLVARLATVKAHEVAFDAVAKLAPSHPGLRLVCVGGGERETELRRLVEELGIAAHVLFTGMRRDVADLVPGFDLACLTSRYECAPLAVIEAMAAGVPVVTADVGAVRDMVTDGVEGYVVPAGDADAFADRIARLAADRALRARLGGQGRARAQRQFRIEDTAAAFERLLREVTAR